LDIDAYLRNQKERMGKETEQVADPSIFDFNYIPDQPLMRDECKPLVDAMLRFDLTGIPTHLAVIGSRGSGKTLTLKFLQRIVPQQTGLSVVYANCRHHNTSFKILAHLLNLEARGASLAELFDRFSASSQNRRIVVLDEIDLMSFKDRAAVRPGGAAVPLVGPELLPGPGTLAVNGVRMCSAGRRLPIGVHEGVDRGALTSASIHP